jgi:hypothetical protein
MNRREMLAASLSAGAGIIGGEAFGATSSNDAFTLIDERLNFKIHLSELKDGECGYLTNGSILASKADNILYFGAYWGEDHTLSQSPSHCIDVWVGRKGNRLHIRLNEKATSGPLEWLQTPEKDCWAQRPCMLAYYRAYPLENPSAQGEYMEYIIPYNWKECAKHPLVQRNIQELKGALAMIDLLRDKYGVTVQFNTWDTLGNRLKAALDI